MNQLRWPASCRNAQAVIDEALRQRSGAFALAVIRFCLRMELDPLGQLARAPLLRAGTGLATHCAAACRARTPREFAACRALVLKNLDDAGFWLQALLELKHGPGTAAQQLHIESQDLRALVLGPQIESSANRA